MNHPTVRQANFLFLPSDNSLVLPRRPVRNFPIQVFSNPGFDPHSLLNRLRHRVKESNPLLKDRIETHRSSATSPENRASMSRGSLSQLGTRNIRTDAGT